MWRDNLLPVKLYHIASDTKSEPLASIHINKTEVSTDSTIFNNDFK